MPDLTEGLHIVGAGIGGVFFNLIVLMVVIAVIGALFGKKKAKS
jgi:Na+-transporting methylmalonyl-CoA/oxaloacetate decarboxylase gamma subunit